jgi:protein SCO1/2
MIQRAHMQRLLAALAGATAVLCAPAARADKVAPSGRANEAAPAEMKGVEIDEKLGATIPLDLTFSDETGAPIQLGSLFNDGKPVILTFNYSSCPMLCSVQLGGFVAALNELTWSAGVEFRVITIGLSPMEGHRRAMETKMRYLDRYRRDTADEGWRFLTGTDVAIHALAAAVGYGYRFNDKTGDFLHPAALMVVSPNGAVSSYIYGVEYSPAALAVTLLAARKGELTEATHKFLLACFHYDEPRGAAAVAMRVMQLGGAAFVALGLVAFGLRARRGRRNVKSES